MRTNTCILVRRGRRIAKEEVKRTVVRGVFFPSNHALGVEERTHWTGLDFVDDTRLEVDVERAGDILARTRL